MVWALLLWCAFARAAVGQVVRIENLAPTPFAGWKRVTVDVAPPHQVGRVGDTLFVVGRAVGVDTRVVDVLVSLPPGGKVTVDLAAAGPAAWTLGGLPSSPAAWFGGWASIAGTPLQIVSLAADGAGWLVHLRARPAVAPMLVCDLWLVWYPDAPGWARGEVMVTASNPTMPAMAATIPAGFILSFGSAIVAVPGGNGPLLAPGTVLADGQARALPVVFVWPSKLQSVADFGSVVADAQIGVAGVGVSRLLANGNPTYPASFVPRTWASAMLPGAVQRLHTFEPAVCGPASASPQAGDQEDSVFTRGEALLPGGVGAEIVAYLSALKLAARPCHHREADGSQLDPARHPQLVIWGGRPHWHTGVSPDRLGKPVDLTVADAQGWWGPDVEHAMFATLTAGARLTGSPALQQLLRQQALQYPLQWTTRPGWSTSEPFAARAVGWEGILAVHVWRDLEDRAVAGAVRAHYTQRVAMVLVPKLGATAFDIWDVRVDDPRLGAGRRWIPWQQALGSYGLDLAGEQFGLQAARDVAIRAARRVLDDAWRQVGGRWVCCPSGLVAELGGTGGTFDEGFAHYGMPLAAAVVLRHEPTHAKARAILAQVRTSATAPTHTRWLAPGVQ
ncbi:MAG: hypothetical protein JNK15_03065 [Planctomycetes bacterium]|nr:hypothetical protein [Planctomycetota bacterium]